MCAFRGTRKEYEGIMSITIFGIIWLGLIFLAFVIPNLKFIITLTFLSMVLQCSNVIILGDSLIGPATITCFVFIVKSYFYKQKIICNNDVKIKYLFCLFSLLILSAIISLVANRLISSTYIMRLVQLILYVFTSYRMYCISNFLGKKYISTCFKKITIFVLIMGIIQFMTTSGVLPRFTIINELFFNDQSENVYYYQDNYYRLCSIFMEPSYCASFLVGAYSFFLITSSKNNSNYFLIGCIAIEMILTFSSTAYIAIVVVSLAIIILRANKTSSKIVFFAGLISGTLFLVLGQNILKSVIFDKLSSGSANSRYYWNKNALTAFNSSKVYGIGYKNVRASSIVYSLLGQVGLIGFSIYLLICLFFVSVIFKNKKSNYYYLGFSFSIISVIVCQFIACPDLDLCTLWLFVYLFGLSVQNDCFLKLKLEGENYDRKDLYLY